MKSKFYWRKHFDVSYISNIQTKLIDFLLFHIFQVLVLNSDAKLYWKISMFHKTLDNLFHDFQEQYVSDELLLLNDEL